MQKQLKSFHQNALKENTYLFFHNNEMIIIDPGVKPEYLASSILSFRPSSVKILYTHGHFDHIIYGHALEQFLQSETIPYTSYAPQKDQQYFDKHQGFLHIQQIIQAYGLTDEYECSAVPHIHHFLTDKQSLNFIDLIFYETPGHTAGSGIFYSQQERFMFTGDTLFANGSVGRTDFPDSSPSDMTRSLSMILQNFPPETIIYPGHAMASTLEKERQFHSYLL
nr:MBL fold metallo-hydrolase [Entomospira entomophilus]